MPRTTFHPHSFFSQTCSTCITQNCYALTSTTGNSNTPENVSGFSCVNGLNNSFQACQVKNLVSTNTTRYVGFYLQDSENISIKNCSVDMIQTDSLGYGIYLLNTSRCTITNNLLSNINTSATTGMGIYGNEQYNIFAENITTWCDIAFDTAITNTQSGYEGSNFMYNVELP
ncbi:hypothetical protein CVU75_02235 [Candidatus Dependentiae bacterium HGW-Dependentiae-1]|nr:MAG: hypothetical protein CVU75_02235 [Candidatus Dependentiae bacterium HGW-Dependentiae-1]